MPGNEVADKNVDKIARVVHEAMRAWRIANSQPPIPPWSRASREMKASTRESVLHALAHPDDTPERQHEQWKQRKRDLGWVLGETKDDRRKTHPLLIPYAELPDVERKKDALLQAIVAALGPTRDD